MYKNPTDIYSKNINNFIKIEVIHLNSIITFPCYITNFSDNKTSSWKSQTVMNKMDPAYTFQNTTSKLNISFSVPSMTLNEAEDNYINIQFLLDSLYPLYDETSDMSNGIGTAIVNCPPLYKIKVANWTSDILEEDKNIFGWIESLNFDPDFSAGVYVTEKDIIYPKLFKINITFNQINLTPKNRTIRSDRIQDQAADLIFAHAAADRLSELENARIEAKQQADARAEDEKRAQEEKAAAEALLETQKRTGLLDQGYSKFLQAQFPGFVESKPDRNLPTNFSEKEQTALYQKWATMDEAFKKGPKNDGYKALVADLNSAVADDKDIVIGIDNRFLPPKKKKPKGDSDGKGKK